MEWIPRPRFSQREGGCGFWNESGLGGKTEFHGARFRSKTDLEIDVYLKSYFSGKYRIWQAIDDRIFRRDRIDNGKFSSLAFLSVWVSVMQGHLCITAHVLSHRYQTEISATSFGFLNGTGCFYYTGIWDGRSTDTSSFMILAIFTSYPLPAHCASVFRCFRENPLMALTTGFNIS